MIAKKFLVSVLALSLVSGCALLSKGPAGDPAPVRAEKLLTEAEQKVAAHDVDKAEALLADAKKTIAEPEVKSDKVAHTKLTKQYESLSARVDAIKEAQRQKKIADAKDALGEATADLETKAAATESDDADADAFDAARDAVKKVETHLDAGSEHESDEGYKGAADAARTLASDKKAAIDKRWAEVGAKLQKDQLDKRLVAMSEALAKMKRGEQGDVDAASTAVKDVEGTLDNGGAFASDKDYKKTEDGAKKAVASAKEAIEARTVELKVAAHEEQVKTARDAAQAAVDGLPTNESSDRFAQADEAVAKVEEALKTGEDYEKSNKSYARFAATTKKTVERQKASIQSAKDDAAVAEHKKAVEAAAEKANAALAALEGATEAAPFEAAKAAVEDLDKKIAEGDELAKKDRGHATFLASSKRAIPRHTATIEAADGQRKVNLHRAELTAAKTKVDEALAALEGSLDHGKYQAAEEAVDALKKTIAGGAEVAETDRGYARELATAEAGLEGHRMTIRTRRVEAAQKIGDEKLAALDDKPSGKDFGDAAEAMRTIASTIEAAKRYETKDRTYGRTIVAAEQKLVADQRKIEAKKIAVEVGAHASDVDAAATAAAEKMAALDGEPEDSAFIEADAAVKNLKSQVEGGESVAAKDKAYAAKLAGLAKQVATYEATITRRRHEVDVARHRKTVEEATAQVTTSLEGLAGTPEPSAFDAATKAVDGYEAALEKGKPVADGDKKYTIELAVLGKKVAPYRAQIEARRTEVAIAKHDEKIAAATTAVDEKLAALDSEPKDAEFSAAEEAVAAFEQTVEAGASIGEKDAKYKRTLAALAKRVPSYRAKIARRQSEVAVATHRARIDSVASAVDAQIEAMNAEPTSETIVAAEKAVKGLEQALATEDPALTGDKKHAAYVAGVKRTLPRYAAAIDKQKIAKEVAEHRTELEAAKKVLEEKLAALDGKLEQPLYQAAENAVSGLRKAIASGADAGEKDAGYARELAAEERGLDGHRLTIKQKWVEAADGAAKAKVEALSGEPSEDDFYAADEAIQTLRSTTEAAAKMDTKDRGYRAFVAGAEKTAAQLEAATKRRRVEVKVAAHQAKVDAAKAKVDAAIEALAESPKGSDFSKAKDAVSELKSEIDAVDTVAAEDRGHKAYLAGMSKQVAAYGATIDRRGVEVEIEAHRADVTAAQGAVDEKLGALEGEPAPAAFDAALEAIDGLERSLTGGEAVSAKDKKYAAELAGTKKKLPAFRAQVERRRTEVAVAQHRAKVEAASTAMTEAIDALDGESPNFDAAASAVDAYAQTLESGGEVGAKDKRYAKELAVLSRGVAPSRAKVESKRTAAQVAAHRQKIDATTEAVNERLAALSEDGSINDAKRAVGGLERVLGEEEELLKKDRKHAAFVAAMKKKLASYNGQIERATVAKMVAEHQRELDAARTAADEKLAALEGSLEHQRYVDAEDALSALNRTIEGGAAVGEKDRGYAKTLGAAAARIPGERLLIRQRRVEAATAALASKVEGLSGEEADFDGAEDALRTMESTIEAAESKSTKDKGYTKFLAASRRTVAGQKAAIARAKITREVTSHRSKVDGALAKLEEQMSALDGEPNESAFAAATSAAERVKDEIGGGESVAAKDKKYAAYLAGLSKKVAASERTIAARRVQVAVAKHAARVEADTNTVTSRIEGLSEDPKASDFTAALDAVDTLDGTLKDGAEVAEKDKGYAKTLAAKSRSIAAFKAQIAKRRLELDVSKHAERIEAAATAADSAVAQLDDEANAEAIDQADEAVTAYEQAINSDAETPGKDRGHAKYVAVQSKKAGALRRAIGKQRTALEVRGATAKIDAARADVDEKLGALVGSLEHARYVAAEDSVSALKRALDAAAEAAANDRGFGKRVASEEAQLEDHRLQIRLRRVQSAESALDERIAALDGEEPDFDAAEAGVRDLETTIEAARQKSTKDKKYLAALAGADRTVKARRAAIANKRIGLQVAAHRQKVDAAEAEADKGLERLEEDGSDAAFSAATAAVDRLKDTIADGESVAEKSKAHRVHLAKLSKKIGGQRRRIEARRAEVAIANHEEKVAAARTAVEEKIASLDEEPKAGDFDNALDLVEAYDRAVQDGAEIGGKSKAYAKKLKAFSAAVGPFKRRIEGRRVEVAVAAHRARVDEAASSAEAAVEALDEAENQQPIEAANSAVEGLEEVLTSVNGLATKDKSHGKYVAGLTKQTKRYRAQIERARVGLAVAKQKSEVEAAATAADESLAALEGSLEHERYQAAEVAVSQLKKTIESSEEVAAQDKGFGKQIASLRRGITAKRQLIRKRRVEAATAQMDARMAVLQEEPKADDFDAALEAARVLENTTDAARQFKSDDKKYAKYLASVEKKNVGYQRAIENRRVELEADKHRATVEEAFAAAAEKVGALDGTPEEGAFGDAEDAVRRLKDRIADGESVSAKNKAYAKELAGRSKKAAAFEKRIAARRIGVAVDRHAAELDAAKTRADEAIDALGLDSEGSAYTAAEDAVADLEKVIDGGAEAADKSKKYAKRLAGERRALGKHRAKIVRKRDAAAVAKATQRFDEAETALNDAMGALGADADDEAFSTAKAATEAYAEALAEAEPFGAKDKKLRKRLAKAKKRVPGSEKKIARVRAAQMLRAHAAKLEAASNRVEERVSQLDGEGASVAVQEAERAASDLEEVIQGGIDLATTNKGHRKTLAAYRKRLAGYRAAIGRQKVAGQVVEHRAELEAAQTSAAQAIDATEGQTKYELYRDAESAVSSLKKAAEGGMELGMEDPGYGKELDRITASLPAMRWNIRKNWVEASEADVQSKMQSIPEQPGDGDFAEVAEAIGTFENTVESGKKFEDDSKKYKKYLSAALGRVKKYRRSLDRKRLEGELSGVRAELISARTQAGEAMDALEESPDEDKIDAAERALGDAQRQVDATEPYAKRDKGFKKERARVAGFVKKSRGRVEKLRILAEVAPHRKAIAEAAGQVEERLAALDEDASNAAFSAAEDAVDEYSATVDRGLSAGEKSKKFDKELKKNAAATKRYRRRIARARTQGEIIAHRQELAAARSSLDEKMGALDADEVSESMFKDAKDAADQLEGVVRSGQAIARGDKKYRKELKLAGRFAKTQRLEATKMSIRLDVNAVEARLEGLGGTEAEAYGDARDAVEALDTQLAEARRDAGSDKKLKRYIAKQAKSVKRYKRIIATKQKNAVLDVHRGQVQAAEQAMRDAIGKLDEEASAGDFEMAKTSIEDVLSVVDRGKPLAKKNKKYKKYLAKVRRGANKERKTIAKRRLQPELAEHRSRVEEAQNAVLTRLNEMGAEATADDFTTALEAVEDLDKAIDAGKPLAKLSKKHKRFLRAAKKTSAKYKRRIRTERSEIALGPHKQRLNAAQAALQERMADLKTATQMSSFEAASEAADDLAGVLRDGKSLARGKKGYKRRLAKASKELKKARRIIRKKTSNIEKTQVQVAWKAFAPHVRIAKKKPAKLDYDAAMEAAERVQDALAANADSKNRKYKKYARSISKKLRSSKGKIEKAKKRREVALQTRALKRAMKSLKKRIKKLRRGGQEELDAADQALSTLERVLEEGEPIEASSKKYRRLSKKGKKSLKRGRKKYDRAQARASNS